LGEVVIFGGDSRSFLPNVVHDGYIYLVADPGNKVVVVWWWRGDGDVLLYIYQCFYIYPLRVIKINNEIKF
jgi:hypothetical protein